MRAADLRFWQLIHQRTNRLQADLATALLRSFGIVRDSMSEDELARIIAAGALTAILIHMLSDTILNRAFAPYRRALQMAIERGFDFTRRSDLPRAGKIGKVIAVHYDPLSPTVIDAARALDARLVETVKQDLRGAVIRHVELGLENGLSPRAIAREAPTIVGLGPAQVEQVANLRAALAGEQAPGEAKRSVTDYSLRDPRVDSLLAKGPLTPAQIERYAELYQRQRITSNVAAISDTAARQGYKTGQATAWREAINTGFVTGGQRIFKEWLQVDRPSKRPAHARMNGQIRPLDQPYSNGSQIPGDQGEWNCACVSRIFVDRS